MTESYLVPVGISSRHLHLSQTDLEVLFGPGYQLTSLKPLSQPDQYAANETVNLIGPKNNINKVRILGPVRSKTQIEITRSDSYLLGITPPLRDSGALAGSPGITLEGPKGRVSLTEGVIVAQRHLHLHSSEAEALGLKDRDRISVEFEGERSLTFHQVLVRVAPSYAMDLHLDTDEANAAGLQNGSQGKIIK